MTDLPEGFYAGDPYCYRYGAEKDATFGCIPGRPKVEISPSGDPIASFMNSPGAALLTLQAVWSATPEELDAVRAAIKARFPSLGDPSLKIAEFSDTHASLTVTGEDGGTFSFGPNPASGAANNRVVFSAPLRSSEKQAVLRALSGAVGVLSVSYEGALALLEMTSIRIEGNLAEDIKALAPKKAEESGGGWFRRSKDPPKPTLPDLAACAASVDGAVSAGRLKISRDETPNVSAALRDKVETALRALIAQQLCDKIRELGEDAIYMSSFAVDQSQAESEPVRYRINRVADIGPCFAGNKGAGLIRDVEATLPEPDR
jgi:hypothetical protein